MPLDHYISQVHLKNFYSPALKGEKMFGVRKRDGLIFPCQARDACRIENGSTNEFLLHDRAIEDFLETVEPRYNLAVMALKSGEFGADDIYVIAGFAAYVTSCSPTAMRLGANPLKHTLETATAILDQQGLVPRAPEVLGNKRITELLEDGSVFFDIDRKYPQAIGIAQIMDRVGLWANAGWDLIHNNFDDSPFFTSDFASAIEQSLDNRILDRIFPLAPDFAVRIRPDFEAKKVRKDFSFPNFRFKKTKPSRSEIFGINRAIVRCAEDLVFFRDRSSWVEGFVRKNKDYWIEPLADRIPMPDEQGYMNIFRMRIGIRPQH